MKDLELQLIDFLVYIKEVHTDQYGQLEICDDGDELDPTVKNVVNDYLKTVEVHENKYNEDEVRSLIIKALTHNDYDLCGSLSTRDWEIRPANFSVWFEHNKKK